MTAIAAKMAYPTAGLEKARPCAGEASAGFKLAGTLDAERSERDGIQSRLEDFAFAIEADTIGPFLNSLKSGFNLVEGRFLGFHEGEREFLLEIIGPYVGHVDGHARQIAARF